MQKAIVKPRVLIPVVLLAAALALVGLIIAFGVGMSWVAAEMEREEERRRRRGRRG